MKVLQVLPTLSAGGAEGFITNLGVSLSERGAEVRFFLLAGVRGARGQVLQERLANAGVDVVGSEERAIRNPLTLIRLVRVMRSWKPDIVQANLYAAEVACALVKMLGGGEKASFVRRIANTGFVESRSSAIVFLLDRFFPFTVACSPSVDAAYRTFMGYGLKSAVVTIPNGGLLQGRVPDIHEKQEARRSLGVPDHAFVVAHIGKMTGNGELGKAQKAHDVILRSFARAFGDDDDDCMLLLVGDGPLRSSVELLARELKIERKVRFLGHQPSPWPALKAADLFFFPSRYEGLPNVLPEAGSCGLPVVASDIPEVRYVCSGDAWLLNDVDDSAGFARSLRLVRERPGHYADKARDAVLWFHERFSMKACAEAYHRFYGEIAGVPAPMTGHGGS